MAHRQKYLAGGQPAITLEEAYWKVMSTITKVNDLTTTCIEDGITTLHQRLEAENLRHILVEQNTRLYEIWRKEKNVEKLYNTRELVQIIDEEVIEKLTALKDTIISLPGTTPNPQPSHLSPLKPSPHYWQEELGNHYTSKHSTADEIKRTMIYAYQHYNHPDKTHRNENPPRPCNGYWPPTYKESNTYCHDRTTPSRKRSHQAPSDSEPNRKIQRPHSHTDERQMMSNVAQAAPKKGKNTANMDAMIPPDIKPIIQTDIPPDVKPDAKPGMENPKCPNTEEDNFIARVAKHSKQILIDDYQPTENRKGGPKLIEAPNFATPTPHKKYRTKQTKNNGPATIAEPVGKTERSETKPILDSVTQTIDEDSIEHRKRKHNVRTNENLMRWLGEDPQRLPKVREDVTRWSEYMATEVSNPAFELFINMAANLSNKKRTSDLKM